MISGEFQCTYCGFKGEISGNRGPHHPDEKVFKRLGRNPFSGHLHYQCPACSVVLLVAPTDISKSNFHRSPAVAAYAKKGALIERAGYVSPGAV